MAENSKIEWTDNTFNPWVGCTKVSPACDHCYAETQMVRRKFMEWGPNAERRRTSEANWKQPVKWNRAAQIKRHSWDEFLTVHPGLSDADLETRGFIKPRRPKVFCASLADVFDNQVPEQWRSDLWDLIIATPYLDWLLLTKRPQNIRKMLPDGWGDGITHHSHFPNVWLGTTVENQEEADRRIPHLLKVPAAKRFLSCEPLLGPVNLRQHPVESDWLTKTCCRYDRGNAQDGSDACNGPGCTGTRIDWVIAGGESGPHARPMHPDWARSLRDQCQAADVPFHFKQWGQWVPKDQSEDDTIVPRGSRPFRRGNDLGPCMLSIGKKKTGALLDGREWREFPA